MSPELTHCNRADQLDRASRWRTLERWRDSVDGTCKIPQLLTIGEVMNGATGQ
jgi:hypothetical protein